MANKLTPLEIECFQDLNYASCDLIARMTDLTWLFYGCIVLAVAVGVSTALTAWFRHKDKKEMFHWRR